MDEPREKERKNELPRNVMENRKKETYFQLFFLKNDGTQNVEVAEADEIDFEEVKSRLERGESVFITRKKEQKSDISLITYDTAKEPWYLIRS
jgi:ABC-type uncharacterized transport system substrate-binding protein